MTAKKLAANTHWYVYMVRCRDNSLYTGISSDPVRRERQHNGELVKGARYTRVRRPVSLVFVEAAANRSAAASREHSIKMMSRSLKEGLIEQSEAARELKSAVNNR